MRATLVACWLVAVGIADLPAAPRGVNALTLSIDGNAEECPLVETREVRGWLGPMGLRPTSEEAAAVHALERRLGG